MPEKRNKTVIALGAIVVTQIIAGAFIFSGCVCAPHFRLTGLIMALMMAAYITANIFFVGMAKRQPMRAALSAALLYLVLLGVMWIPYIRPSLSAWYAQLVPAALIVTAILVALRKT